MVVSPLLPSTNRNTPVQAPQLPCVQIYPVPVPAAASTQFPARSRRRPQRSLPLFLKSASSEVGTGSPQKARQTPTNLKPL
jgi:hypothetical protein